MYFNIRDQLLFIYSALITYGRKKLECYAALHQLFRDLKKAYDSNTNRGFIYYSY